MDQLREILIPDHFRYGVFFCGGVQVLLLLAEVLFHKSLWLFNILFCSGFLLCYVIAKTGFTEEEAGRMKKLFQVDVYISCISLVLSPYCALYSIMRDAESAFLVLGVLLVLSAAVGMTVFLRSEKGKAFLNWVDSFELNDIGKKSLHRPGDVMLCNNIELLQAGAEDPRVYIPYKDRFLHMLILGPTGCGKTSQIIIPMVYQDIHNLDVGVTIVEPKGDLARKVAMMAKEMGRDYLYFDPSVDNCPFFNPLVGDESDVIENAVTTFLMLDPDSPQFFKDLSEQLIRNTLKVLKRLDRAEGMDGKYSTFIWMSRVLQNSGGQGRELVNRFSRIVSPTDDEQKENADIASWFMNEYYMERSKVYENSSGIRSQVAKVIANPYLRRILNPDVEKGEFNQLDFDQHLAQGGVICISTAQGMMRKLGTFLGYFLILQLQSAVFRRPGNENNRRANFLYIDEFQTYATPGFSDMLTQGRSYRVASHLATQARAQ